VNKEAEIDRLMDTKKRVSKRWLIILYGAAGVGKGKKENAKRVLETDPELPTLEESVHISQDEVIASVAAELFARIANVRFRGAEDVYEREAFLVESLSLYHDFLGVAADIVHGPLSAPETSDHGPPGCIKRTFTRGQPLIVQTSGTDLPGIQKLVQMARMYKYKVAAFFSRVADVSAWRRELEMQHLKELTDGRMRGSRNFGAYMEMMNMHAEEHWLKVKAIVDKSNENFLGGVTRTLQH